MPILSQWEQESAGNCGRVLVLHVMYWRFVPTFWRNVLPLSSGCPTDVDAEVFGRKECVICVGKFENILAGRGCGIGKKEWRLHRDNGDYFSIILNHSVTPKVEALCLSETPEEPFTEGVDPLSLPNTVIWETICKSVLFVAPALQTMCSVWSKASGLKTLVLSFIYCAIKPLITVANSCTGNVQNSWWAFGNSFGLVRGGW